MTTIRAVIDTILKAIPGALTQDTVDTIKVGDAEQPVTGIATTFLASQAVLQKAVALGANLVITHEPTFYNHLDQVGWLEQDPVYLTKRQLIEDNRLVIWRFHDNWHIHQPDGLLTGIVKQLGWEAFVDPEMPAIFKLPPIALQNLVNLIKAKLGIRTLRLIGDPALTCQRVGILVGAWGGMNQIGFLSHFQPDVLVVGEIAEWETSEYIRDAVAQGRRTGLIITGHANSEEPGMNWLVEWLKPHFPGLPVHHVPVGDPFQFM